MGPAEVHVDPSPEAGEWIRYEYDGVTLAIGVPQLVLYEPGTSSYQSVQTGSVSSPSCSGNRVSMEGAFTDMDVAQRVTETSGCHLRLRSGVLVSGPGYDPSTST